MKVNVTLALELPDTYRQLGHDGLQLALYEEIQQALVAAHLDAAMLSLQNPAGTHPALVEKSVAYHREWADTLKTAILTHSKVRDTSGNPL